MRPRINLFLHQTNDFVSYRLLETGSTALIRNTAAEQLADVQKQHPDELFNLLTRVIPYLRSKAWDTRTATARAIGGIVSNADKFDPNAEDEPIKKETNGSTHDEPIKQEIKQEDDASLPLDEEQLQLSTLDVASILAKGKPLLASTGKEYDYQFAGMDPAERLAHQKKSLTARLGLGGEYIEEDLLSKEDFVTPRAPNVVPKLDTSASKSNGMMSPAMPMSATTTMDATPQTPNDEFGMSKRQLNMLKRKKKMEVKHQVSKVRVVDFSQRKGGGAPEPVPIKSEVKGEGEGNDIKSDYFSMQRTNGDDKTQVVSEFKGMPVPEKSTFQTEAEERGLEWPYERLMEFLTVDLFDHDWNIRHGAAMGIREVVRVHGAGAGRIQGKTRVQNDVLNRRWLDDLACRLCCVFMLDRFGDYHFDTVVVPVRETAGQALGALLQYLPASSVKAIFTILRRLVVQDGKSKGKDGDRQWQPSHGGILGMRYLVAVRNDLLAHEAELLDGVLEVVMQALEDNDDDVRAVAAGTLIPIAQEIVELRPTVLNDLIMIIWDCLSSLSDDLSASTGFVMDLLAKLCSFPQVLEAMKKNAHNDPTRSFAELVPRLYPFLRHTITTVRSAVLRALLTFLDIEGEGTTGWINGRALRLIFQNLLVERNEAVLALSLQVWRALVNSVSAAGSERFAEEFEPHVDPLVTLTISPVGVSRHPLPMDATLFIKPSGQAFMPNGSQQHVRRQSGAAEEPPKKRRRSDKNKDAPAPTTTYASHNIDGPMIDGDVDLVGADVIIRSKIFSAQALGMAMCAWPVASRKSVFAPKLLPLLHSPNSSTQLTTAMVIQEYAKLLPSLDDLASTLAVALHPLVEAERPLCYSDLTSYLQILRAQCQAVLTSFKEKGHVKQDRLPTVAPVVQGDENASQYAFGISNAEKIVGPDFDKLLKTLTPMDRIVAAESLNTERREAEIALEEAKSVKEQRDTRIKAAAAAALVALKEVPKKPSSTIKGMMDSIKKEDNIELQRRSAAAVAALIDYLATSGRKVVVEKVVDNLVKFCCMETAETPEFHTFADMITGILSLKKDEDVRDHAEDVAKFERDAKAARITRRGAKEALEQLAINFGAQLFDRVPNLRALIEDPIRQAFSTDELPIDITAEDNRFGQQVVDALSTLRALVPRFHASLKSFTLDLLPLVAKALHSKLAVFRYMAAKCFATVCSVMTVEGITMLVQQILPSISNALDVHCRQGVIECVYHLIHVMGDGILPYVIFLIVPVLGRMSDSDDDVRLIATTTFATLVKLVPLEAGIPDPPGLSEELLQGREKERKFIAQMLDARKVEPFEIPVAIKATLRSYQQDGVNWLHFLNRYNLHGILCDDMGLGKTLQTLCIVASDHHDRAEQFAKTQSPDFRPLPSLIVCPPTLSGHWQQEIRQFAPFLKSIAYVGPPAERGKYRSQLNSADIVITSYDICRNDNEILAPITWNYCVLDEGHLIKNPRAKTTIAVKNFNSNHRLILSGTPIQNNVLELWSLFDFLMPGFLGTEKVFQDRFSKPIQNSRNAKSSSKEQETGALAIEALHKQVLPFLLRRLKEEVLDDLPPKILQNYYCDLSDLQKKLFEDFTKKEGTKLQENAASSDKESKQHIFQALQYMRKLCNSPALVMKENHKQYAATQALLSKQGTSLRDPAHAPKLSALRDLLVDCGIGVEPEDQQAEHVPSASEAVSQHRALIFCQMKEMVDMVQDEVLRKMLPRVQFLRLDGNTEASKRQDIVNTFNSDPSYDVLLLTTSVGGLGLNLTGADTVIFVEHDWNPQKDIQAMDRAHRIGQKKVVNVYRIVTRGTLEEKILK